MTASFIPEVQSFLGCATPERWLEHAIADQETLLIDHAHCEKKAAATALHLMFRYVEYGPLLQRMSRLAREELRHFEQVLKLLEQRQIEYRHLTASRYAESLRNHCRKKDPERLIDILIVGAFIEARSCERFSALIPLLDAQLADFYQSLLRSEARHFKVYLRFAEGVAKTSIEQRIGFFRAKEQELILSDDSVFRFHSGPPTEGVQVGASQSS